MTNKQIANIAMEAARLLKENPGWSYRKAIEKARDTILHKDRSN